MAGRQETSRPGAKDCMCPPQVVAFGCNKDGGMRRRRRQQTYIYKVDIGACRSAEENHIEFLTALNEASQIGCRAHIGNAPAFWLMSERQFQAVATQPALVDNRKMAANRGRVSGGYALWEGSLVSRELVEHGSRPPQMPAFNILNARMTPGVKLVRKFL